jgi:hypothetical protein
MREAIMGVPRLGSFVRDEGGELASRFYERAAECARLAELASDAPELRRDYCHLANCYLLLAQAEISRAEQGGNQDLVVSRTSERPAIRSQTSAMRINSDPALSSETREAISTHSAARSPAKFLCVSNASSPTPKT